MSGIREAMGAVATLIGGLEITAPYARTVPKVWPFPPPRDKTLAETPCAILGYEQRPVVFGPAILHKPYSIHIQFFAGRSDAELDVRAAIAAEFNDKLITALSGSQLLGGTVSVINGLRGEVPESLVVLNWNNVGYVGLDLWLDVTIVQAASHAA